MMVIRGTVASQKAYNNFAPCLMIPPCSCETPGRKPGTSSNVIIGILNASQNLTNRAPLIEASISRQPARTIGCCATMPTTYPSSLPNPTMIFGAYFS